MTIIPENTQNENCPAQALLKSLSGKWKPEIFKMATNGPIRFSEILRNLPGSNKQSVSTALKELEEQELFIKKIISEKPLHIEYLLSEKGKLLIPVFVGLESFG